jgi:restriction endonuclease Mrr
MTKIIFQYTPLSDSNRIRWADFDTSKDPIINQEKLGESFFVLQLRGGREIHVDGTGNIRYSTDITEFTEKSLIKKYNSGVNVINNVTQSRMEDYKTSIILRDVEDFHTVYSDNRPKFAQFATKVLNKMEVSETTLDDESILLTFSEDKNRVIQPYQPAEM